MLGREQGLIEWRVKVREGEMITRVVLRVESTVFGEASVKWLLGGGDLCLMPSPGTELDIQVAGATQVLSRLEVESQHFSIYLSLDLTTGHLGW